MPTTLELVNELSDSKVIEVTKELFNEVYRQIPYDEVRENWQGDLQVASLASLSAEQMERDMSAAESARFGRLVLEQFASDPQLEPFLQKPLEKVQGSDDLIVGEILAVGFVINLTLLMATTSLKLRKNAAGEVEWQIAKKSAPPKLVESIVVPMTKMVQV